MCTSIQMEEQREITYENLEVVIMADSYLHVFYVVCDERLRVQFQEQMNREFIRTTVARNE